TTTGADWGSFPQDFVDFQMLTGQSSYWYSSGGAADAKKPAKELAVSWTISTPPAAAPTVSTATQTLSADGVNTITVTGTGFDPSASIGTRPPLMGVSSGVYVIFGVFPDTWKPSEGVSAAGRANVDTRWAVPAESVNVIGGAQAGAIVLQPDGSFSTTLSVSQAAADQLAAEKGITGNYGIYTFAGGGATVAAFETYTPLSFEPGLPVTVEIPEGSGEPGEFSWQVVGNAAVSMGTATETSNGFAASGALPNIEITDTRVEQASWSLTGQVSDFTGTAGQFSGSALGWTPVVSTAGAGAQAGTSVAPEASGGLGTSKTLAHAAAGHAPGTATVAASLELRVPLSTPAGSYTGVLTVTGIG
ncbi:MAG: hypothetical protein LBH68_05895, partial [Bifidobacteriaceae bacterium]|nr:hypothetical protein [Bifidobacteriaceae bacterium]